VAETIGGVAKPGKFCCHPAVGADGDVYLAYATGIYGEQGEQGKIQVLRGIDPDLDNSGPLVFSHLMGESGQPVAVAPQLRQDDLIPAPSSGPGGIVCKTVPYLVCDPTSASRLFVFYHDVPAAGSSDSDAMMARFTKSDTGQFWSVSTRELYADVAEEGVDADQFLPVATVDGQGRIHVIYYDNRPDSRATCQQEAGLGGAYDLYYSLSWDHGVEFTTYNLRTDCESKRPLNLDLQGSEVDFGWSPREYNGISFYEASGTTRVWVVYSCAVSDDGIPDTPGYR
jgi:hypothetical protein